MLDNILSNSAFLMVNQAIYKEHGPWAAILIGELVSRKSLFKQEKKLWNDGSFWCDNTWLQHKLAIGYSKLSKTCKILEQTGFIKTKNRQVDNVWRKFYFIQEAVILDFLLKGGSRLEVTESPGQDEEENLNQTNLNKSINGSKVHSNNSLENLGGEEDLGEDASENDINNPLETTNDCGIEEEQEESIEVRSVAPTYDNNEVATMIRWFGKYGDEFLKKRIYRGVSDYKRLNDIYNKVCKEGKDIPVSEKTVNMLYRMRTNYIKRHGEPGTVK